LAPLEEAEFQVLRETIGISDSVLSKHIKQLEEVGYLKMRKGAANGRQRTWVRLTGRGRQAFAAHVAALQEIVACARG
jgi:DNA-binding MarR family transcriptional regulator